VNAWTLIAAMGSGFGPLPEPEVWHPRAGDQLQQIIELDLEDQVRDAVARSFGSAPSGMPIFAMDAVPLAPMPITKGWNCSNMPIYVWKPGAP
jgi:hypothetical protein